MKDLTYFLNLVEFLGEDMTEGQAIRILDEAKRNLGISDMARFKANATGELYTLLSEHEAEMGGFNRYY